MARKNNKFIVYILLISFIVGILYFVNQMDIFEKKEPIIYVDSIIYNNLKEPILINIKDDISGIKDIKVILKKDLNDIGIVLAQQNIDNQKDISVQVVLPKLLYKEKIDTYLLEIQARDASFWNYFSGNLAKKLVAVSIDTKNPDIKILTNSTYIEQGGAGSVVFKVDDKNIDQVYIQTNKNKIFEVVPYIKNGYYASLIAWDAKDDEFRAYIVAKDKAGNTSKSRIRYYFANKKYKNSNININDNFLDGKIEFLANKYAPKDSNLTRFEKFKFVNETLRLSNEELIHKMTSSILEDKINNFKINIFVPLKNSVKVGDFADHRYYFYDDKFISDSYHLGVDLASVAKAPIISSNGGKIIFAQENGIYGLNLIAYHGFGIYSLYGHCSSKNVDVNENIKSNSVIGKTGTSGLALGDHVHFGVLIQGVEVRPEQWQDKNWIKNNIYKVLEDGKKIIMKESI